MDQILIVISDPECNQLQPHSQKLHLRKKSLGLKHLYCVACCIMARHLLLSSISFKFNFWQLLPCNVLCFYLGNTC